MVLRSIKLMVAFALTFVFVFGNIISAFAETDITPPTIKNISFDKTVVRPGDTILIQVEAEDLESGIGDKVSDKTMMLKGPGSLNISNYINLTYNASTNKYEARYPIPSNATDGTWSVYYINFADKVGNHFGAYLNEGDKLYKTFMVDEGSKDTTPPKINGISFNKTVAQPGETVLIQVDAEDLESGIGDKGSDKTMMLKSPGSLNVSNYISLAYNASTNKYEANYTVPTNAVNGTWAVYYINFADKVGNHFGAYPIVGDPLYKTFTVINGSDDITPPTIKNINFDKKAVRPGDSILIQVEAEDLESGIGDKNSDKTMMLKGPGSLNVSNYISLAYNSSTNRYEAKYTVPENAIYGTWSVYYLNFADKVGNHFGTYPIAGDLLYKTFRVNDDIVPPNVPTIDEINDQSTIITGTAEVNSTITVKLGRNIIGTTNAGSDGKFSFSINKLKAGTIVTINATDVAGNESENVDITVKDVTAPNKPIVDEVTDKAVVVTGSAEANSTVLVKSNSITLGTAIAKDNGTFSVYIPLQTAGNKLTIIATDAAGNVSTGTNVIIRDTVKPIIVGADDKVINVGELFNNLQGVYATDNNDGDITANIQVSGTIDNTKPNVYTLTYRVSDSFDNVTTVNRHITVIDLVKPIISGIENTSININTPFDAKRGVTAQDNVDGDVTKSIQIIGSVNTNKKGVYNLIYTVRDTSGNTTTLSRNVTVIDNIKPVITGATNKSININSTFNPLTGVTAQDNVDGVLTDALKLTGSVDTKKVGTYKLTYTVSDSSDNKTTLTRTITVIDNIKPIISGASSKTIAFGSIFNALTGVIAKDNVDGDLTKTIKVTGVVNTKKKGIYTLTYTVSDKSGNKTIISRKITVKDMTKPVIYGATTKIIKLNSSFNPRAGVTAKDNADGDLTKYIKITGTVNTKKKGTYTLTYTVKDFTGNTTVVYRKIIVK
ncbi:immunoglobulin-like domain-containing protein [Gottfriedia sp. NPDC057991]|uniref:immunoglobulin-like domain-containing protein n=1 Tax=Gottfriedia sp. NPDC057991 TaxID=3346298 RepID=UPI0036D9C71E